MMEKKYQLVAWTKNVADAEKARLYMIPSLESEVQASLIADLAFIHQEEYKFHGRISVDLARRAIKAYVRNLLQNWRLFGEIAQKLCHMRVVKWHSVARFYVVPND